MTKDRIITGSGESSLKIHSTSEDFPIAQALDDAHKLGCHHIAVDRGTGTTAVSVGFGGEVRIWKYRDERWKDDGKIEVGPKKKAGEAWAICLSFNGQYLASTTHDGRLNVWDLATEIREKVNEFETKGSFGMIVDMVGQHLHDLDSY